MFREFSSIWEIQVDETCWCQYATDWTEIEGRWELTMTEPEAGAVVEMLSTYDAPPELQNSVYGSCDEAESAGEERVQGSQGGGRGFPKATVPSARDGDGDGIVCER